MTEHVDRLTFENEGNFYEGEPESYVIGGKVPHRYRNPFLVQAMTELNMIDQMGYGIHDIFRKQVQRYLPLPGTWRNSGQLPVPNSITSCSTSSAMG